MQHHCVRAEPLERVVALSTALALDSGRTSSGAGPWPAEWPTATAPLQTDLIRTNNYRLLIFKFSQNHLF